MFDFDASKLLIVGVVALIFIPPKDLPRVLRQVGQFVGKMRRMASEFQGQFMEAMREADMADLRLEAQKLADAARVETKLDSVVDLRRDLTNVMEAKPKPAADGAGDDAFEDLRGQLKPLVDNAKEPDFGLADPERAEPHRVDPPKAEAAGTEPGKPADPLKLENAEAHVARSA